MIWRKTRAGIILAAALSGVGAGPLAHAAGAPPIRQQVAVPIAPEHAVPDAGDSDEGLEAREAIGAAAPAPVENPVEAAAQPVVAQPVAGTLDAQYAALRAQADLRAQAAAPPPGPAADTLPPPALLAMADQPVAQPTRFMQPSAAAISDPGEAPAAPTGASVALARRVVESAQAFTAYMQRAAAVRPDYQDAGGVAQALRSGSVYESTQLDEGTIAYVAMAALQDAAFVEGVSRSAQGEDGRAALASHLAADPRQVLRTPGATQAAMRAASALARYGVELDSAGAAVKRSAYDIQHADWSRTAVSAPAATLAELKARSAQREALTEAGGRTLLASLGGLRGAQTPAGSGRLTPVVAKGLTLAALAVLGKGGEDHDVQVAALLADGTSAQCLKMARLNLYQCLSVAGPQYEDVFCLGEHAMMETARCVANASGWTPASAPPITETPAMQLAAAPARPASIMVPAAFAPSMVEPPEAAGTADPDGVAPGGAPPVPVHVQLASTGWR